MLSLLVGACAAPGTTGEGGPRAFASLPPGSLVEWGGLIVDAVNHREETVIEVLALPLASDGRPRAGADGLGRFLVAQPGYLETLDYARGRYLTVVGTTAAPRTGLVGKADYRYPVVVPRRLTLWPRARGYSGPRVHFGLGVLVD